VAHFAKINENNEVVEVIVVNNNDIKNLEFPESESVGQDFLRSIGLDGTWLQTSYNKKFRGNYAGPGFTYDSTLDAFISPKPHDSWVFDEGSYGYKAPVAPPLDSSKMYDWDETSRSWKVTN